MKKIISPFFLLLPFLINAQLTKTLKQTIQLKMPGKVYKSENTGADSIPGTRGASVAWHPVQKKYYASFAGNYQYPMAVFNASGKLLSDDDLQCMADTRGLWYDSELKKICGNGYSDIGWFSYNLDGNGIPKGAESMVEGMIQPDAQSVGTYNPASKMVHFLYGQEIYTYSKNGMEEEDKLIRLYPGIVNKNDIDEDDDAEYLSEDYNGVLLIYTGIPKAEFGLLNIYKKQVELYNSKTGLLTQLLKLPANLPTWSAFNFSYANGIYWAFDQDTRTWTGYK